MRHLRRVLLALAPLLGCNDDITTVFGLEWSWEEDESLVMPAVGDLDGDGTPEVVAVVARLRDPTVSEDGAVVVLDGSTGALRWRLDNAQGRATAAIGDVNGDGRPDVVYAGRQDHDKASPIHAVDADGAPLWASHRADGQLARVRAINGAITLANLDTDPGAEVAIGGAIFDHDGLLVWEAPEGGAVLGSPHTVGSPELPLYTGSLATFADLTGDGRPELLTGKHAWKIHWTPGAPPQVAVELLWQDKAGLGGDGYPAVADIDANGTPEVVLLAWPEIHVLDGATGQLWCGVDPTDALCQQYPHLRTGVLPIPGGNLGGPPTIADFDGDGRPEAAIAGGEDITVYDFRRADEQLIFPNGDPPPDPGAMYRRWSAPIQDQSSAANGVVAFDFNGDGATDLAHQDECYVRLFDGPTGAVTRQIEHTSATIHEYPVVADVDGDGASELIVAGNFSDPMPFERCGVNAGVPEYPRKKGIFVYSDPAWPASRPLWTSHTHHLSNVDDRGNAPLQEDPAWKHGNSFRENVAP